MIKKDYNIFEKESKHKSISMFEDNQLLLDQEEYDRLRVSKYGFENIREAAVKTPLPTQSR